MQIQVNHRMVMAVAHPDGSQEWACPTCGRRLLMKWPPDHSRAILEQGDPSAVHSGEVSQTSSSVVPTEADDPYLVPFKDWIENYEQ